MKTHTTTLAAFVLLSAQAAFAVDDGITLLKTNSFEIPDSTGITMIRIEAGRFLMGSPREEVARAEDEVQHVVTISKPFYMAETEITQDQYLPVMSPDYKPVFIRAAAFGHSLPEVHQNGPFITESAYLGPTDKNPMDGVSWPKAVEFCRILTGKERKAGRLPEGYVYRLPTEAEWEYACRAGTGGPFNVEENLTSFCWGPDVGKTKWTKPVKGRYIPNAWGLYDMHGNVYEWCHDWYTSYDTNDLTDPAGSAEGEQKVARGGSWNSGRPQGDDNSDAVRLRYMRSASRNRFPPDRPLAIIGFRPVLAPILPKQQQAQQPAFSPKNEPQTARQERRLTFDEYADKMKAGWVGQMAGVGWGGPTEFRYKGLIIPEDKMPQWQPEKVNQFQQDDIYVEMTFLQTLEKHGLDCSIRQAGIDFANSGYNLWHANRAGRDNLRRGIAPPDSGHPQFNKHADDIDYQIEADYSGLIAPGMPQLVIDLGEKFGRLMNYGDGLYAGQFVGGMYAEAFFENDMVKIVEAGLRCIPAQSQYAGMVRDMLAWYEKNPDDWQKTWQWCEDKYHKNSEYSHGLCSKSGGENAFSIDAKLNGAYIIMGLLYGKGDPDRTIIISTRCGQDSDCNPSNAGGILFTTIGFSNLPGRFVSELAPEKTFSHTPYDFPTLIEVSKKLVRQAVARSGGRIEKSADGGEVLVLPDIAPKPSSFEPVYQPGPIAGSTFTAGEQAEISKQ